MVSLRVAMVAPPWLPVPPVGYGGVENVLNALIPELMKLGVRIELFTTGDSTIQTNKNHWLFEAGQYGYIHQSEYVATPAPIAQVLFALNTIRQDGGFDLIHDHNGFFGPMLFGYGSKDLPPTIHTLHGPPFSLPNEHNTEAPNNLPMWRQFKTATNLWFVPISKMLANGAPAELKPLILEPVHNMVDVEQFPFVGSKGDYFITLARFHPEKGQHVAVKTCLDLGFKLKMAGGVAGITSAKKVLEEISNPSSFRARTADVLYFKEKILPFLSDTIQHIGEVSGAPKLEFISNAKALLFPLQWDEPFGMVALESLACGTPVVAMDRGAMPEIIEHGVNGFLAKNFTEFKYYTKRVGDIDPHTCRESVKRNFSAAVIAKQYLKRYQEVLKKPTKSGS